MAINMLCGCIEEYSEDKYYRIDRYSVTKSGTLFGTISFLFNILRNNINLYLILFFCIGANITKQDPI